MTDSPTRRELLRGGAVLATATAAGCTGLTGGDGSPPASPDDGGSTTSSGNWSFTARNWLVDPETAIGYGFFGITRPRTLADSDYAGTFARSVPDGPLTEATGIDGETVETVVGIGLGVGMGNMAWRVDADVGAVADSLRSAGFEAAGSHRGFDLFANSKQYRGRAVGVRSEAVVFGAYAGDSGAKANLKAVIDAHAGENPSYPEVDESVGTVVDELAGRPFRLGQDLDPPDETDAESGQFAGNTGVGYGFTVADSLTMTLVLAFEDATSAKPAPVGKWIEGADTALFATMSDPTVEASGPVVVATGSPDPEAVGDGSVPGLLQVRRASAVSIDAGVSISMDDPGNAVTVVWTSNQNADYLAATFEPEDGSSVRKRLDNVGGAASYEGEDGTAVTVVVTAYRGDFSKVIAERTVTL